MTYEDQLRDALNARAGQLDDRRPPFDAVLPGSAGSDKAISGRGARRWQLRLTLAAAAAVAVLFAIVAVGNRSVDRVETGPEFATEPTKPVPTASADEQPGSNSDNPSPIVTARGLGPATVVGPDGEVIFVFGDVLPDGLTPEVADLIEAELMTLPVLGEEASERRDAIDDAGLVVRVGLDLEAQQRASTAMEPVPAELDAVAVTVDHRTGEIVSAVSRSGSTVDARRAAGSARIVTYAAALELGFTPQSMIDGTGPCEITTDAGSAIIDNFDDGAGSVRFLNQQALEESRCAEARLEEFVGSSLLTELMQMMMHADLDGSIVDAPQLTAIQHVGAVAAIANGGQRPAIGFVSEVATSDGSVVYERPGATPAVSAETAEALASILQANVERGSGTGTRAKLDDVIAGGLTGSDVDRRAAWFVGSASDLSTAVWVARPDGEPAPDTDEAGELSGDAYPAELWARIHQGFADERGPDSESGADSPPATPRGPEACPLGFPVAADTDDDGNIDTCSRRPREDPFERPTPPTAVDAESCPPSHPVATDIDGDGINETCATAGFTFDAPVADYATSIEVAMQTGAAAADRWATARSGGEFVPTGLIHVGSAFSGTELIELFRWQGEQAGPVAFGRCFGKFSAAGGDAICEQVDRPGAGPDTGGSGPISEDGVEVYPAFTQLLDSAPIGGKWFVVDTDLGARIIANVVGRAAIASWPSEAGGPARFSVLDENHVELWSFTPD